MIEQARIERARAVPLLELLPAKGFPLEQRGRQYFAKCPFHDDHDPSLAIDTRTNLFKCFGCGAAGDPIRFIELYEKKSFPEAVAALAAMPAATNSPAPGGATTPRRGRPVKNAGAVNPQELLNRVSEFYHTALLKEEAPRQYLVGRGLIDPAIYRNFKLGYANGALLSTLPAEGPVRAALQQIGILTEKGRELLHNCVSVPLLDADGNTVGMYGRRIDAESAVRHLYLPGPRRGLVNRPAAATADTIILTESIIDALSLCQQGFPNAIPLYGTNGLTEDHLALFQEQRPRRLLLCLDNDEAGKQAAAEIAGKLSALGFSTGRIALPRGKDVNEYFQAGGTAAEFARLIAADKTAGKEKDNAGGYSVEENELGLVVSCGERQYRIRGIPHTSFDRLRVNIRATCHERSHLDTLDLYQSKSRRYFAATLAKRLEIDQPIVEADLLALIEAIEAGQARRAAVEQAPERKAPAMTAEQEAEALAMLKDPQLIERILADLAALGHVGEETNKILAYLIAVSRKLPRPLSGIVVSGSGAGKSGLVEAVQELTPPEDVEFFSRITPQALYYMERDALKRKLLIIEERAGGEGADYSIRTLQTRRKLTQAVPIKDPNSGRIRTMTFEVEGPIAYLETTANPELNHENATRCFELYLDESPAQTRRIHQAQRSAKTGDGLAQKLRIEAIKARHHNMQRLLLPVMVEIPYAPLLDFPVDSLRTRRDHERFLSLIEAVAFLFQHQRERREIVTPDGEKEGEKTFCVPATPADYAVAHELAGEILGFTLDDLKKHARELLDRIVAMVGEQAGSGESAEEYSFTRRDIREYTAWPDHQVKAYIKQLEELEYLSLEVKSRGQFAYRLNNPDQRRPLKGLLSPADLQQRLAGKEEAAGKDTAQSLLPGRFRGAAAPAAP